MSPVQNNSPQIGEYLSSGSENKKSLRELYQIGLAQSATDEHPTRACEIDYPKIEREFSKRFPKVISMGTSKDSVSMRYQSPKRANSMAPKDFVSMKYPSPKRSFSMAPKDSASMKYPSPKRSYSMAPKDCASMKYPSPKRSYSMAPKNFVSMRYPSVADSFSTNKQDFVSMKYPNYVNASTMTPIQSQRACLHLTSNGAANV